MSATEKGLKCFAEA